MDRARQRYSIHEGANSGEEERTAAAQQKRRGRKARACNEEDISHIPCATCHPHILRTHRLNQPPVCTQIVSKVTEVDLVDSGIFFLVRLPLDEQPRVLDEGCRPPQLLQGAVQLGFHCCRCWPVLPSGCCMRHTVLKDVVGCHWSLTTRALSTLSNAKFCVHVVEQAIVSSPQAEDLDLSLSSQQMVFVSPDPKLICCLKEEKRWKEEEQEEDEEKKGAETEKKKRKKKTTTTSTTTEAAATTTMTTTTAKKMKVEKQEE